MSVIVKAENKISPYSLNFLVSKLNEKFLLNKIGFSYTLMSWDSCGYGEKMAKKKTHKKHWGSYTLDFLKTYKYNPK